MPTTTNDTGTFRTTYIYKVNNPHTGAVEFPEHPFRLYAWVGYALDRNGRSHVVGYSNAATEAAAVDMIARNVLSGTEVAVVPARPSNAAERDTYLARRAQLAPTDAERTKWAKTLINAAIDYLRSGDDEADTVLAKEHVADMASQAMHFTGAKHMPRGWYTEHERRLVTRAENAARMFLIVERDLDNRGRAEAIEYRITQYLGKRDALIRELEAIAPY
jgi:hypothetical protein